MVRFESKILPPADADEVYSKLYALINSVGTVKGKTSDEIENETFNLIKKIETNAIAKKLTFAQFLRGMDRALELLQAQVWRIMQSSLNKQKSEHQRPVQQQLQESYSLGMKRKIPEQTEQLQQKQQKVDNHFVSQQSMQQAACTGTMQQLSTQYEQQPQPHHMTYAMHQGIDRQLNGQFTLQPQQLLQHNMKHCSVELPVKPVGQVQNSQLELHSYPVVQPLHQLNAPQPIPPATVQPLGQFQQMQPQQLNFQQSPMLIQQLSVNQQEDMPLHTMQYIPQCNALPPSLQHKREDYQPVMQLQQKLQTNQVHLQHSTGHSMHKQQLPLHMYPMQSTQQYSLQQQRMSSLHQSTQQPQQHLIDQRYAQPFQQQSQVTLIQQYSIPQPLEILLPEQNCPASHPPSQSMAYSITHCDNKPYISLSQTNIFSAHPIEQSGTIYHPQSMPAQQQQQQQHQQQQQQQFMQQQTHPITFASNYSNSTSQTHTTPPTSTADSADSMMSARQESRLLEWFITSKPKLPRLLDRVRQSSNLFSNDTIREGVAACERLMGLPVPTHEHHDDIRKLYLALRAYNSMLAHYKKQQQQHVASNNGVMENKSQVMGSDHHMHINSSMNHQSDITINNSSTPHHVHQTEVASVGPTVQHVQQYHIAVPQDNPPLASLSSAENQKVETFDYPVEAQFYLALSELCTILNIAVLAPEQHNDFVQTHLRNIYDRFKIICDMNSIKKAFRCRLLCICSKLNAVINCGSSLSTDSDIHSFNQLYMIAMDLKSYTYTVLERILERKVMDAVKSKKQATREEVIAQVAPESERLPSGSIASAGSGSQSGPNGGIWMQLKNIERHQDMEEANFQNISALERAVVATEQLKMITKHSHNSFVHQDCYKQCCL